MAVLRLLAVYFGAAGGTLLLARRFVSPIRWVAAALLLLGPFLLMGRALCTAGVYAPLDIAYNDYPLAAQRGAMGIGANRNPTLSDVVYQEIPFRKAAREALQNGRLPLWNRFLLAGEPLLATQQPQVFHPTTWAGLLLPLSSAWTFEMAYRTFLALLCAYLFLREVGCGEGPSLLGATGWAFSDYLVFYAGYPLSTAAAPFPLLLLGLRRLARDADRRAMGLTVAALLANVTGGHPETLLHVVAGAGVFFLFDLARADRARRLRALGLAAGAGVLTLGLSAVLLLPFWEAAQKTMEYTFRKNYFAVHTVRSEPLAKAIERSSKNLVPYAFGEFGKGKSNSEYIEPAAYAGSLLLPLVILGLGSRRREKWPLVVTGLVGIASWSKLPGVADGLAKLPFFDIGLNERMVFLGAFAFAALAAFGVDRLEREPRSTGPRLAFAAVATILLLAILNRRLLGRPETTGMNDAELRSHFLVAALPLAIGAFLAWFAARRRSGSFTVALLLVLLLGQRRLEAGPVYATFRADAFYPQVPLFDRIPRGQPWRVTAVGNAFVPNISAMYELEDVRGYEAMTFLPLFETFPLWCVSQPVWFNRVDDPTSPFLSFLNVRYVYFAPGHDSPAGWKIVAEDGSGRIAENPAVLPRAFVPRRYVREPQPGRQVERLAAIRDFAESGVVEGPTAPRIRNGEARVAVAAYAAQRLELEIVAREGALIASAL
ncbi:MAG TPA: hypothetical protein VIA45_10755, partial [Thermoanaerobaculia bacterium]